MPNRIDITGERYGKLVAKKRVGTVGSGRSMWECLCDCGQVSVVYLGHLRNGHTTTCGCLKKELKKTHGMTGSKLYLTWQNVVQRSTNPNHPEFHYWGGRGITISHAWRKFENFQRDMQDSLDEHLKNHSSRQTTIDRIDNNKGYESGNCRWATMSEQNYNRRAGRLYKLKEGQA